MHMHQIAELIEAYGYWAVLFGTLLEGESVLLLAGFAAHRGYLDLATVMGIAVFGSFIGDQGWFFLGRYRGAKFLSRFPRFNERVAYAQAKLARYHTPLILAVRFLYGLRIVLPFTLGMSSIPTIRFQALNLIGAVLWSVAIAALGYLFGNTVEYLIGDLHHYEKALLTILAVLAFALWFFSRMKKGGQNGISGQTDNAPESALKRP